MKWMTCAAVIGGADGPTSVFIAGKVNISLIAGSLLGILAMAGILIWILKKR